MSHRSLATHARSWGLPSKEALCPQRGVKDLGRDERWGRGESGEKQLWALSPVSLEGERASCLSFVCSQESAVTGHFL